MNCFNETPEWKSKFEVLWSKDLKRVKRKVVVWILGEKTVLGEEDVYEENLISSSSYWCISLKASVYKMKRCDFKRHIHSNETVKEVISQ